ncbi:MAG: 50S ribosomal protein L35 [Candidatus Ryanbacteria bacterium]|nr:50S ribosomal protein L35 [Candidatus Ryanbacteria bacterium]
MAKTNKSVFKRIRVTKTGKILKRHPRQNHFNAKERRVKQLHQKGWKEFALGKIIKNRYLPNL